MPYRTEWVDPEKALEHNGVVIYVGYDEQEEDHPLSYWFSVDKMGEYQFDVRDLATKGDSETPEGRLDILRRAIEAGELPAIKGYEPEEDEENSQPALG
jgi:hypothetical protein